MPKTKKPLSLDEAKQIIGNYMVACRLDRKTIATPEVEAAYELFAKERDTDEKTVKRVMRQMRKAFKPRQTVTEKLANFNHRKLPKTARIVTKEETAKGGRSWTIVFLEVDLTDHPGFSRRFKASSYGRYQRIVKNGKGRTSEGSIKPTPWKIISQSDEKKLEPFVIEFLDTLNTKELR